jgi:superfamily II DNA or RNA helicase
MSSDDVPSSPLIDAALPDTARSDKKIDDGGEWRSYTIVEAFEIKALAASTSHQRIAGYWDIKWLKHARKGLEVFIGNGHKMDLLIGIPMNKSMTPLMKAVEAKKTNVAEVLVELMQHNPKLSSWENFHFLQYMLYNKHIEIRIHLVREEGKHPRAEHAKIQIYRDSTHAVGSSGSKNDTTRGNSQGVDFITITKSWSSPEAINQIQGMQDYFNDHWDDKHPHTYTLEEIKDDPEFRKLLENLADREEKAVDPYTKLMRLIGLIPDDIHRLIVVQNKERSPVTNISDREDVVAITIPSGITTKHVFSVIEDALPVSINRVLLVSSEALDEEANIDNWAQCWKTDDAWNFKLEGNENNYLNTDSLNEKVLEFFQLEPINVPEPEPEPEPEREEITRPDLVPELIVNYPYEGMYEHHIRTLRGNQTGGNLRRGEQAIEGGYLATKRGLFEHATGSGKTGLGLVCAAHMLEEVDFVVVVCPKISIAHQWWKQTSDWFYTPDNPHQFWSHSIQRETLPFLEESHPAYLRFNLLKEQWADHLPHCPKAILITVQKTFLDPASLRALKSLQNRGLKWGIIVDEAHRFIQNDGTSLPKLEGLEPSWRLALSASFDNRQNPLGSAAVLEWFTPGKHIETYPLASALLDELLKPFEVHLHQIDCELDPDSFKQEAQNFVVEHIQSLIENGPTILFANESTVSAVEDLCERIRAEGEVIPETYTYNHQGINLLDRWKNRDVNPLASISILDEGIDVSACSGAIMLDSSEHDHRQWIQRRGRTLRIGGSANAVIHDFYPPYNPSVEWSKKWWNLNIERLEHITRDSIPNQHKGKMMGMLSEISSELEGLT